MGTDSRLKMLSALPPLLRNYSFHGSLTLMAVPSINVLCGYNSSSSSSSDPYTKITEQPRDVVESLAETLELRAAEEQQTLLRKRVLAGTSGRVLEVGSGTGAVCRHLAKLPQIQCWSGPQPPSSGEGKAIGWWSGLLSGLWNQAALRQGHSPFPNHLPRRALTQPCSGLHCSTCQRSNRLKCWQRSGGFLDPVVSWLFSIMTWKAGVWPMTSLMSSR